MPDKIQQEIEDLLSRLDTFPPPKPWYVRIREAVANALSNIVANFGRIPLPRLNTGYAALAAIFIAVMAYFLDLANWIIIGAILAFIVAFVLSLRRSSRPPTKYWRDQPMDLNRPGPDWRNRRRR